jgi:hypothetical protein
MKVNLIYRVFACRLSTTKACRVTGLCFCGDKETRTLDPLLAKQVLYQLSYTPDAFKRKK